MVQWCIRLTRLTLVCEMIRYRLVQVRQNLKKRLRVGGQQSPFSISSSFILSFVLLPFFLNTWRNKLFTTEWCFNIRYQLASNDAALFVQVTCRCASEGSSCMVRNSTLVKASIQALWEETDRKVLVHCPQKKKKKKKKKKHPFPPKDQTCQNLTVVFFPNLQVLGF